MAKIKTGKSTCGENVRKEKQNFTSGGSAKSYDNNGNQSGGSSENWKQICLKAKDLPSWPMAS